MTRDRVENQKKDCRMDNCSFMRNSYLEIRNPIKDFKIIGQHTGKWAYFDKDKKPIIDYKYAKFQKWVRFSDIE